MFAGKLLQVQDRVKSTRPFAMSDSYLRGLPIERAVRDHLQPLCNIVYSKGEYYVYQAESLLNEPGLTAQLTKKSKVDRYFVTNQIKSIASKASVVVNEFAEPSLVQAVTDAKKAGFREPRSSNDFDPDEDDELDSVKEELKQVVSRALTSHECFIGRRDLNWGRDSTWARMLHSQGELDRPRREGD